MRAFSSVDHLDRLRVVADHPLHELDVGAGVLHLRQVAGLGGGDDLARLARRARLHDRRRGSGAAVRHEAPAATVSRMAAIGYRTRHRIHIYAAAGATARLGFVLGDAATARQACESAPWAMRRRACLSYPRITLWAQPVNATIAARRSAADWYPNVFRGRSLSRRAMRLSCACESVARSRPLGKY